MGRIKGPITIKNFKGSQFMADKILEAGGASAIKLPFTATGFSCTKIPKSANLEGIEFAPGFDRKNPKIIPIKKGKSTSVSKPKKPTVVEKIKEKIMGASSSKYSDIDSLIKIKGIGKKTVAELKELYKSIDFLKEALEQDAIYSELRDDVVDLLRKELGE